MNLNSPLCVSRCGLRTAEPGGSGSAAGHRSNPRPLPAALEQRRRSSPPSCEPDWRSCCCSETFRGQRSADLLKGTSAGWKLLWCDCCWSNITFYNCDDAFRGCCESPRLQAVLQFILYSVNYSFLALNYFEFLCNLLNQCLKYRLLCVGLKHRHRFVSSSVFFKK